MAEGCGYHTEMLKSLLARFRWLISLISSAIRDPKFDAVGAGAVMLPALTWDLGKVLLAHPDILLIFPMGIGFLIVVGAMFFGIGAVGWLAGLLAISFIRWRLSDDIKPRQAWPTIVLAVAGLIFFGIPELWEKATWWQEHVFRRWPNETVTLKACQILLQAHSDTVLGLVVMAAIGCGIFWGVYLKFQDKLRAAAMAFKELMTGRDWRVPAILAVAIAVTIALLVYHPLDLAFAILFFELAAILLWLLAPVIRYYLLIILVGVVWLIPAAIVNERIGGNSYLWYFVSAIVWGAWLFWSTVPKFWPWRVIYWAGTSMFTLYLVL